MKVIILGAGVVGIQIATQLVDEGKDVVLLEKDPERAKFVDNHLDCIVINEEGNNIPSLTKAGVAEADFFISVADSDEVNMIACGIVASEFKRPIKIARVRNLTYSKANLLRKPFLGIDYIVSPEVETARIIANTIALGANSDVMLFEDSTLQIRNVLIDKSSFFRGKTILEIKKTIKEDFLISGIIRKENFIIPTGETKILEEDDLYFLATKDSLTKIFMESGKKRDKTDNILIIGGGKIGELVCRYLVRTGRKITILEKDYETTKTLSAKFPEALVLNGDISDDDIFEEERFDRYDLMITITNNQELNVLAASYGKNLGIKKVISLVTKINYQKISSQLGIDITISPKIATVDAILKYIRRGNIKRVHTLFEGQAEIIEFEIDDKSSLLGKKIKEISIPKDCLILSIRRKNNDLIPHGEFKIELNDLIIIIAQKEAINKLETAFQ